MKKIKLKSPAKINLNLKIVNKRPDGYHNLLSIMQTINIFDKIKIKKNRILKCICNNKNIPTNNENLAIKAAIEFFKYTNIKEKVKIKIFKKIPVQAGLGGGSSNAATVLIGLNQIFETNLNKQELCNIAAKIGADVPFFIFKKTALVSGIGEKIKPLNSINLKNILVIKPKKLNINTKKAFLTYDSINKKINIKNSENQIMKIAKKIEQSKPFSSYCVHLSNDFENIIENEQINKIKTKLKNSGAQFTLMTGSGSSIFSIFENIKLAKEAQKKFPKKQFLKFLCKTI